MELVGEILLKLEELPYDGRLHEIEIEGRAAAEVTCHVMLTLCPPVGRVYCHGFS
jgi:hypothetical protein